MVKLVLTLEVEGALRRLRATPERVQRAIMRAMPQIGQAARTIMILYLQGKLKRPKGILTGSIRVEVEPDAATIGPHARSATGFPYPVAVDQGRKEVVPIKGKYLSWVSGGRRIFAKRVAAFAGYQFIDHTARETPPRARAILASFVREEATR